MRQSEKIFEVAVLVMQSTNTLSLAAAVDPLRAANRQAGRECYQWGFYTPRAETVTLTSGVQLPAQPVARLAACNLLIVVAGFDLEAQSRPQLLASLRRLARGADCVAGIDGGPWLLARAGLLDGHRATTHWEDLEIFARTFPDIQVENARFVESGACLTSGGAAPALEMMLHLISAQQTVDLAQKVSGSFIYDAGVRPESPQQSVVLPRHVPPLIARAHALVSAQLDVPFTMQDLARHLGVSLRVLQLHFRAHLGTTPQAHALALRLAEADRRVRYTREPLQEVALATGFRSQASFARAYRKHFGEAARRRRGT
ncbi:MAG: helix-turn-helix domain-containing protein [Pseudomonadota bacterium]